MFHMGSKPVLTSSLFFFIFNSDGDDIGYILGGITEEFVSGTVPQLFTTEDDF